MLPPASLRVLTRLLKAPGPSGFELPAARVWRAAARSFAAVEGDVAGNSFATVHPAGSPTILLTGHIDEIGLIVTYIDDHGYIWFSEIGGWDPTVLVGQRVRILTATGELPGVINRRPTHMLTEDEQAEAPTVEDLWIDTGLGSKAEVEALVAIGDPAVLEGEPRLLAGDKLVSRAIDNRVGAFIVLEVARRYAQRPGAARLVVTANTQEEITAMGGGARIAAARVEADLAIVVDLSFAGDYPTVKKEAYGNAALGSGPMIGRGSVNSPMVVDLLRRTARAQRIPYTMTADGTSTGTDAEAVALARRGTATGFVGVPTRYLHTPTEMVSLKDVEATIRLLTALCRRVTDRTPLIPE